MNPSSHNVKDNIVVGLDIGTTKICVIVARKEEKNKIEILGSGVVPSRGVQDGEVHNIFDTSEDIRSACEIASQKTGVEIKDVFVGIAGSHIKSTIYRLGYTRSENSRLIDDEDIRMLEEQVKLLTNKPGDIIISYQPQEYYIDNVIPINNNPKGNIGNRLEADWHVITGNESSSKKIEMAVEHAGLNIINIDLEPIASASAVLTQEQMQEGVCLIDIGGGTTDIAIFTDGIIRHTAIFPYAGEYITNMIRNKFKLRYEVAKKLKESIHATSALYQHIGENKILTINNITGQPPVNISQRHYCRIVNACLENIFEQVKKEIDFSYYKNRLNAGIVVTGGGAMIPDLKNFVEQFTGKHTQIGYPISRLSNLKDPNYAQPLFATSIGLALLASNHVSNQMVDSPIIIESHIETEYNPIHDPIQKPNERIGWLERLQKSMSKFLIDENSIQEFND